MTIKLRMEHDGKDVWEIEVPVRDYCAYDTRLDYKPDVPLEKIFEEARHTLDKWSEMAQIRATANNVVESEEEEE